MALASRQFWSKKNSRPNFNKNNSSGTKGTQRVRTYYNCGNVSHFVAECPYEKREDNGGKFIQKDKAKSFPNKSNFTKKTSHKALVSTMRMMMMKMVSRLPCPLLPLQKLHEYLSSTHPMRTSPPSASCLKPPTR